jgi:hypothetical protein
VDFNFVQSILLSGPCMKREIYGRIVVCVSGSRRNSTMGKGTRERENHSLKKGPCPVILVEVKKK